MANDAHDYGMHVAGIVSEVRHGVAKHATTHGLRVVDASKGDLYRDGMDG